VIKTYLTQSSQGTQREGARKNGKNEIAAPFGLAMTVKSEEERAKSKNLDSGSSGSEIATLSCIPRPPCDPCGL
jgi:hypothetical protein